MPGGRARTSEPYSPDTLHSQLPCPTEPTSQQPVNSNPAPPSRHGAPPSRSRNGRSGGIKPTANIPRESHGPRGSLTQHLQSPQHGPLRLGPARLSDPETPGRPNPKPRPGQRTPMAALGSSTGDHPTARVAGSIPVPLHSPIPGVDRWRWPRRAGRCCVAQFPRRRSQTPRLATLPPAQATRRRSSAIPMPRLHFPRRGCPATAGNAP